VLCMTLFLSYIGGVVLLFIAVLAACIVIDRWL